MPPFFLVKHYKKLTQANGRMIARRVLRGSLLKLESINKPNYLHMRICAVNSPTHGGWGRNDQGSELRLLQKTPVCIVFLVCFFFQTFIFVLTIGCTSAR